ncbi:hypothetical protein QBC44DRAFT_392834 [Cladorrhinum sp. PSN332]|nr:hypothetical protein QBC44DRAFT_392834 [Cladorrhinum sp. PSN332]
MEPSPTPPCGHVTDPELLAAVKELIEQHKALLTLMQTNAASAQLAQPEARNANQVDERTIDGDGDDDGNDDGNDDSNDDGSDDDDDEGGSTVADEDADRDSPWVNMQATGPILKTRALDFLSWWRQRRQIIKLVLPPGVEIPGHEDPAQVDLVISSIRWLMTPPRILSRDFISLQYDTKGNFRIYYLEAERDDLCKLSLSVLIGPHSSYDGRPIYIPSSDPDSISVTRGVIWFEDP